MKLTCGLITMHGSRYFSLLEKPIEVLVKAVVNLVQTSDIKSINMTKHKIMRINFEKKNIKCFLKLSNIVLTHKIFPIVIPEK